MMKTPNPVSGEMDRHRVLQKLPLRFQPLLIVARIGGDYMPGPG